MEKGFRLGWSKMGHSEVGGSWCWGTGGLGLEAPPWAAPGERCTQVLWDKPRVFAPQRRGGSTCLFFSLWTTESAAQPRWSVQMWFTLHSRTPLGLGHAGGAFVQTASSAGIGLEAGRNAIWVVICFSWHALHRIAAAQVQQRNCCSDY